MRGPHRFNFELRKIQIMSENGELAHPGTILLKCRDLVKFSESRGGHLELGNVEEYFTATMSLQSKNC